MFVDDHRVYSHWMFSLTITLSRCIPAGRHRNKLAYNFLGSGRRRSPRWSESSQAGSQSSTEYGDRAEYKFSRWRTDELGRLWRPRAPAPRPRLDCGEDSAPVHRHFMSKSSASTTKLIFTDWLSFVEDVWRRCFTRNIKGEYYSVCLLGVQLLCWTKISISNKGFVTYSIKQFWQCWRKSDYITITKKKFVHHKCFFQKQNHGKYYELSALFSVLFSFCYRKIGQFRIYSVIRPSKWMKEWLFCHEKACTETITRITYKP